MRVVCRVIFFWMGSVLNVSVMVMWIYVMSRMGWVVYVRII